MGKRKVTVYLEEDDREWLWRMRELTGDPLPALFKEMIEDFRGKKIAEEIGCRDPDTGRVFIKVAGQDFPQRERSVVLDGGRPPNPT